VASTTLASAPLYLRQLCRGKSCLTSPTPSLAWDRLPTKTAQSSSHKQQPQSTTQMAIQSSQAGKMRLVHGYGIFLSPPRLLTSRIQLVPQRLGRPSQLLLHFRHHHLVSRNCLHLPQRLSHLPCLQHHPLIPARASWPPTRLGLPAWSTTYTAQPRLLPWLPEPQVPHLTHTALISPALVPWLGSIMPALVSLSSKLGSTLSKLATATPSRASPTPMRQVLPNNAKMSGQQNPS
jgi:hypothetical protein